MSLISSNDINYCWPSNFPDEIPNLSETYPASGTVYRLVRNCPPKQSDFRQHREEHADYVYCTKNRPKSYGISVWSNRKSIQRIKTNYSRPEQFGSMVIVSGDLCPELGVMSEEEINGHITVWLQDGATPHHHIKHKLDE